MSDRLLKAISDMIVYIGYVAGQRGFTQEEGGRILESPLIIRYVIAYDPEAFGYEKVKFHLPNGLMKDAFKTTLPKLQMQGFLFSKNGRLYISDRGIEYVENNVKKAYETATLNSIKYAFMQLFANPRATTSEEDTQISVLPEPVKLDAMLLKELRKYPKQYFAMLEEIMARKIAQAVDPELRALHDDLESYYLLAIEEIAYLLKQELKSGNFQIIARLIFWLSKSEQKRHVIVTSMISGLQQEESAIDSSLVTSEKEAIDFVNFSLDEVAKFFNFTQNLVRPKVEFREDLYYGAVYLVSPNIIILNKNATSIGRVYGGVGALCLRCQATKLASRISELNGEEISTLNIFIGIGEALLRDACKGTRYERLFPVKSSESWKGPVVAVFSNFEQLERLLRLRLITAEQLIKDLREGASLS